MRERVTEVYQEEYVGFGPTLYSEKLAERHQIDLSRETVRGVLLEADLWKAHRRGRKHRRWRERKACFGETVQVDGSHHDWLEGRGPKLVLMGYVDDATGEVSARFYGYEGVLPAFDSLYRYTQRYGLPVSVYVDRHTTYCSNGQTTLEEELAGQRPKSQFERALEELGVGVIHAHSPQAKGRVERLFQTFQDRLIKEMRLEGIASLGEANTFLEKYLPGYNRRFRKQPQSEVNLHRPVPEGIDLQRVLAIQSQRTVQQDNTIRYAGKLYLIEDSWKGKRPQKIQVEERRNGKRYLMDGDRVLQYREIKKPLPTVTPSKPKPALQRRSVVTPAADHPWRRPFKRQPTVGQVGSVQAELRRRGGE